MNKIKLYTILVFMLSLTGCGSDGATSGGSISVLAESGDKVDVSGEWVSSCYIFSTEDWKDVYVFSGNTWSVYLEIYTTTDGSCSGTSVRYKTAYLTTDSRSELATVVTGEKTLTGWSNDGFDTPTTAPNSQAGPALPNTPTTSTLDAKWFASDSSGDLRLALYIDDSDTNNIVLYSSNIEFNPNAIYPDYLRADKAFIKQ